MSQQFHGAYQPPRKNSNARGPTAEAMEHMKKLAVCANWRDQKPSGFYPYTNSETDANADIQALYKSHYGKPLGFPASVAYGKDGSLSWDKMCEKKRGRYAYMPIEMADRIIERRKELARKTFTEEGSPRTHELLSLIEQESCSNPNNWPDHFKDDVAVKRDDLPAGRLFANEENKTVLYAMMQDMKKEFTYDRSKYIFNPFPEDYVTTPELSWNVLINMAAVACALENSKNTFAARYLINPNQSFASSDMSNYEYMGCILLKFDKLFYPGKTEKNRFCKFVNENAKDCRVIILPVYRKKDDVNSTNTKGIHWEKYRLFTSKGFTVEWGDFAPRKRFTYYEVRQLFAQIHNTYGIGWYVYELSREIRNNGEVVYDKSTNKYRHWFVSHHSPAELLGQFRGNYYENIDGLDQLVLDFHDGQQIELLSGTLGWANDDQVLKVVPRASIAPEDGDYAPEEFDLCKWKKLHYGYDKYATDDVDGCVEKNVYRIPYTGGGKTRISVKYAKLLNLLRRRIVDGAQNTATLTTSTDIKRAPGIMPNHSIAMADDPANIEFVELLYAGENNSDGNAVVIAYNGNISATLLSMNVSDHVTLCLMDTRNVTPVVLLKHQYAKRVDVVPCGTMMSRLPTDPLAPVGVIVVDIYSTWTPNRAAYVLLTALRWIATQLRVGGSVGIMMVLPTSEASPAMIALAMYVKAFESVSMNPDLANSEEHPAVYIALKGFTEKGRARVLAAGDDIDAMRENAAMCRPVVTTSSRVVVPRALIALVSRAYKDAYEIVERTFSTTLPKKVDKSVTDAANEDPPCRGVSYRTGNKALPTSYVNDSGTYRYDESNRDFEPRCHWGQLKLLLSEWDFLNSTKDVWSAHDTVVIYAGAADGAHIPILASLFPSIRAWFLFDGRVFAPGIAHEHKIHAFSGRDGFVTDETVKKFKALSKGSKVLYISDIRSDPTEALVKAEMTNQARWGIKMDAEAMLLKFRPPYYIAKEARSSVGSASAHEFGLGNHSTTLRPGPKEIMYLNGQVQRQLFAPMNSTETRLFVRKPYTLSLYDVESYESECYFYNISTRRTEFVHMTPKLDFYIPGFDRGWESSEAFRIAKTYEVQSSSSYPPQDDAVNARSLRRIADVMLRLSRVTQGRKLTTCVNDTNKKYAKKMRSGRASIDSQKLEMWKSILQVNTTEMIALQKKFIREHAVEDGVFDQTYIDVLFKELM